MRVYISHASEDQAAARELFHRLKKDGFDPWLDEYSFGPGEWPPQIEPAIQSSDVFVFLISQASTGRAGLYDDEIKFALKLARQNADRAPTIIPLRLAVSDRPANLKDYLSYDLFSEPIPPQKSPDAIDGNGYERFKEAISNLARKTSRYVFSLHGIKTRGVWQKEATSLLAQAGFIPDPRDFGYFRAVQLVWPRSRRDKVERFVKDYTDECNRLRTDTPSIVAHSYGTYIAGEAMLKYPEIKFDRMILCGAILRRDFPWADLAKNGQVNAILNQYGGQDFWARIVAWGVADAGQSGRHGFSPAECLTQQSFPQFRHSDYFYDLNYMKNWLPFLKGERVASSTVAEPKQANWRFRSTLIVLLALAAALAFYFLRGCALFQASGSNSVEWHIVDASATPRPTYLLPLDRVLDDMETPLAPQQQMDIDKLQHAAPSPPPVKWLLLLSSPVRADQLPSHVAVADGIAADIAVYVLDAGDGPGRILTRPAGFGRSLEIIRPKGSDEVYLAAFVFPLDRSAYEAIRENATLQSTK